MASWKFPPGILTVEFTSAVPETVLDTIIQSQIPISHVKKIDELTYQFQLPERNYKYLEQVLQKRGDQLKVVKKQGVYLVIQALFHRPVLLCLLLSFLFSSFFLPSRIFFVAVDGNTTIPDQLILSAAENCGIRFAASRKHVRSEQVKNALLSALPQLQWAGINTSGCTAVISVRERIEEEAIKENVTSSLFADRDGYVLSATVTSGTAHVVPGDAVTQGQLLISGYADNGICLKAVRAEGETMAQTNRNLVAVMAESYGIPVNTQESEYRISLCMGKKRINLWKDSRIFSTGCGRMYEEYYVSLPGGFRLPMAICVDQYFAYDIQQAVISEDYAQLQLQHFSDDYLMRQMVAGQMIQKQQYLSKANGLYQLYGNYTCAEFIGREQREQIGVINGKRN